MHRPGRTGLQPRELLLVERIKRLKKDAGTHSPSAWTLAKLIPELRLKVDACFLSNPYATKLFLMHFHREVIRPRKLRALLELYPSQNRVIAAKLGRVLDLAAGIDLRRQRGRGNHPGDPPPIHPDQASGQSADVLALLRIHPARHRRSSTTFCARKTTSASTPRPTSSWSSASGPTRSS